MLLHSDLLGFFTTLGTFKSSKYSYSADWTFLGISMRTGPLRPEFAISKASMIVL